VDDRVDRIQRPGAPRVNVLEYRVGDQADRVAADLGAVELGQMRGDVADGQPAGVEPEDLLVQAGQPGGALGQNLRLEAALVVVWCFDLYWVQVILHCFGGAFVAEGLEPLTFCMANGGEPARSHTNCLQIGRFHIRAAGLRLPGSSGSIGLVRVAKAS